MSNYYLGLDPGTTQTAWCLLNDTLICDFGIEPNEKLMTEIVGCRTDEKELIVVCEAIACFGMAVGRETFETVRWEGRYWEWCASRNVTFKFVSRIQVKQTICHDTRAKDSNIRQALIDLYGQPGTKKQPGATYGISKDVWSALAIATTGKELRL